METSAVGMAALAALLATTVAGCAPDREDPPSATTAADPVAERRSQADLERLRALPYVGSVPIGEGEGMGVVRRDPVRSHPGVSLYAVQMLALAELIDEDGRVLRSWHDPDGDRWERVELLDDGGLLAIGADRPERPVRGIPDDTRYLMRFDRDGRVQWKRRITAHHDVERTPDGRLLLLTFKRRRIPQIHPDLDVRDDYLTLTDEEGKVLAERSLLEAFAGKPDVLRLEPVAPNTLGHVPWLDLFHANSLERLGDPALAGRHPIFAPGNLLVSLRHQNAIIVVSWERAELVWAWGRGELLGPHDARLLDGGHLLVFDNGLGRGWSRVLELDPIRSKIVWEYRGSPPESFYSESKGSSQRLPNGNTLIAESDRGRAFEVTRDGEIVWDFYCPHVTADGERAAIVRMVRYERGFFRPALGD